MQEIRKEILKVEGVLSFNVNPDNITTKKPLNQNNMTELKFLKEQITKYQLATNSRNRAYVYKRYYVMTTHPTMFDVNHPLNK